MGLKNIVRTHVKKLNVKDWELVQVPKSIQAIVALNLPSYASGRNPWGHLSPEYLEKRGFLEANPDNGLLELFGLKQGWHASFVMMELIPAKHITQAAGIRLEIRGGDWQEGFTQIDGEPWKQPLSKDYSTFVEIKRVPHHSLVVKIEQKVQNSFRIWLSIMQLEIRKQTGTDTQLEILTTISHTRMS